MAARLAMRRHAAPLSAALLASSGVMLYPRSTFAESPESQAIPSVRKPIYDDPHAIDPSSQKTSLPPTLASPIKPSSASPTGSESQPQAGPTPTDRLAAQIRHARLFFYHHSLNLENAVNENLTRALNLESSVANTIASLAPPRTANEPLVPGVTYTLVAMLAGSIITRNRGIILRFSVPVAFGLVAANTAMPVTMANVGELIWRYEEKYPEVAKAHLQAKDRLQQLWATGKDHTIMTKDMISDKVDEARKGVEDWVSQGK